MTDHAAKFTIGQLADAHKLSLRTLRFYEEAGLIAPERIGNARYYSARDRIRLELIQKGKLLGFSLREIKLLLDGGSRPLGDETSICALIDHERIEREIGRLEGERARLDDALQELRSAKMDA